jgi:acyl-CoA thioesterase I
VLAFGDSLTHGEGANAEAAYAAVLAALLACRVVNSGVSGEVTSEGLARLPGELARASPDLVILCLGGNDMLRGGSTDTMGGNLDAMITMIRSSGADAVLVAVPKPGLAMRGLPRPAGMPRYWP